MRRSPPARRWLLLWLALLSACSPQTVEPAGATPASAPTLATIIPTSPPPSRTPSPISPPALPAPATAAGPQKVGAACIPAALTEHVVHLAAYDPATGLAGDLRFPAEPVMFNRIFMDFGFVIPGDQTSTGQAKANPQPTFLAPLGTPVRSLVDGVVDALPTLWSTESLGDISIHILPDGLSAGCYAVVETEHVIHPTVAVGDWVKAGQVIAEVGPLNAQGQAGLGTVEVGILTGSPNGFPLHVCPFAYFAPDVREQRLGELKQLMSDWEAFVGDDTLYDEAAWADGIPGCLTTEIEERPQP